MSAFLAVHASPNRPQCDHRDVKGQKSKFGLLDTDENMSIRRWHTENDRQINRSGYPEYRVLLVDLNLNYFLFTALH